MSSMPSTTIMSWYSGLGQTIWQVPAANAATRMLIPSMYSMLMGTDLQQGLTGLGIDGPACAI